MPSLQGKRISAHVIRHTTATHLLWSGVDINTIRAWLGHVSLDTTNIYAETDLATKKSALATLSRNDKTPPTLSSALNLAKGQRSEFPVAVLAHTCQCVLREGGVGRLLIAIIEIGAAPFGLKTTSSLEGTRWLVGSAGSASTA
jgi:hypothetical protein